MKASPRSAYVLELSVGPGGSRWAELHAYTDPSHIRSWINIFCGNPAGMSAYHALWYGATLGIWVVQDGVAVEFIDLHPYILARLGDAIPVPLTQRDALRAMQREAARANVDSEDDETDDDEDERDDEDAWDDEPDFDVYERYDLSLSWSALAERLPALKEPLLAPGQSTLIRFAAPKPPQGTYLNKHGVCFGSLEAEQGERLEPPFRIEGWNWRAKEGEEDELE